MAASNIGMLKVKAMTLSTRYKTGIASKEIQKSDTDGWARYKCNLIRIHRYR